MLRSPGADSTNERPRTKRPARSDNGETMAGFKLAFSITAQEKDNMIVETGSPWSSTLVPALRRGGAIQ